MTSKVRTDVSPFQNTVAGAINRRYCAVTSSRHAGEAARPRPAVSIPAGVIPGYTGVDAPQTILGYWWSRRLKVTREKFWAKGPDSEETNQKLDVPASRKEPGRRRRILPRNRSSGRTPAKAGGTVPNHGPGRGNPRGGH